MSQRLPRHYSTLKRLAINNLSPDLLLKKYSGSKNKLAGYCYVASEALYHIVNEGKPANKPFWKPQNIRVNGISHWYLKSEDGLILDATDKQFTHPIDYSKGKGKGFLTSKPSRRAKELINRIIRDWYSPHLGHSYR